MLDKLSFLQLSPGDAPQGGSEEEHMALDDARRIKVLSPGMLVFKRFIRNKLAVVGFCIIAVMFLFSFAGAMFSPYEQTQVFVGLGSMLQDYASATYNTELRYTLTEGESFGSTERAQFLLALGKGADTFVAGEDSYTYVLEGEGCYRILQLDEMMEVLFNLSTPLVELPDAAGLSAAFEAASASGQSEFAFAGETYRIVPKGKGSVISRERDVALATLNVFDAYHSADEADIASYDFRLQSSRAIINQSAGFTANGRTFTISYEEGKCTVLDENGADYAEVSNIIVNPLDQNTFLSVSFKAAVREAINELETTFSFVHEDGEAIDYDIVRVNTIYNIKRDTPTTLIRMYEPPSTEHLLGLDNNGMDLLTRLMYGGQVSLLVGFVVIFIEVFLGVVIGGISGYFGGWVDTALMRFVDLFNSIPFYPMVIIFGSVMDTLEVSPQARIYLLMIVLGVLGWTGIARVVRGQILSLREQDFMVATEATGIRTGRRIFRHLVPNVMPLLIVQATAGLGGVIISEATLGFLGLGVKYPLASWGSIINVASDAHVMTNYWFMWFPAGMLILLTVLGFNFVGDGLRDAFDPKMKR
ncbi:MAG: ABC transporter permease [Clostridia bacterium]|nr:ABC transporter permease [Clostridia bacterium]